jgi:glycosyltransferase involved in cell wall biosynthesis
VLADGHDAIAPPTAPLVVQVHEAGWSTPELREVLEPDFLAHIAAHTETNVRAAAQVITPSESARRDIVEGYGVDPDRVHNVPHGVDPAFSPEALGGRELVARARDGEAAPYVLHAAMLHPRKNLEALRSAMSMLAAAGLPHVLAIAGGPASDRPDSSDLERAAVAELEGAPGRVVRFSSPNDAELAGLMAEADAFCLPSLYEGFGLTVLEAMACGTPVVVSDRGALPEVVGDAGLVVPPTAGAVADALIRVLEDRSLADRLEADGVSRARQFTWSRTAAGWLNVLQQAANDV